ncbi:RNA-directed DNA polymerase [Weissella diestrammenae]|uniref:RNA-directed DNA polymerase n=1 Tax=Weissella diestrammenae TaxID=1162633 RepID=A0A7G9T4H9_9LACO|nr:retron Ec67 family RNA-directed DNA polymerase/endonuclease [Weissella diestrammenae]MCM0582138.1 retron Ec67 family RNA-directed DNA polymerase/endonuclease [Weissella diestrammenae]QNN75004.1 RNA-directed DNA polymerase [Weissella diestrammenae]
MNLNEVNDVVDLARVLHYPSRKIKKILYRDRVDNQYFEFSLAKKSGGSRLINVPNEVLADLQNCILIELKRYMNNHDIKFSRVSQAYQKDREKGIYRNARIHRGRKYVINVDLEDFFPSIHFGRVVGFFEKNNKFKFTHRCAILLAQLVCYKGYLPQGASTSPLISNLICHTLDIHILKIAKKYHLRYSRFADDLTFSTNDDEISTEEQMHNFIKELTRQIGRDGFKVNWKKMRIAGPDVRHTVTGLVNNKIVKVKKEYYKNTRAMVNQLFYTHRFIIDGVKYNIENDESKKGGIKKLEGRLAFIDDINRRNNIEYLDDITKKAMTRVQNPKRYDKFSAFERMYRQFLFFKNFWQRNTPLIVTEGKTDVLHLKEAIKNSDILLPNISFFKPSSRFDFFLGIGFDGASKMDKFINLYIKENSFENLSIKFRKIDDIKKENDLFGLSGESKPVILLFDHEFADLESPINMFINNLSKDRTYRHIESKKIEELEKYESEKQNSNAIKKFLKKKLNENGFIHLVDNLYVLVIKKDVPSINEKYAIEGLYPIEVVNNVFGLGVLETYADNNFENVLSKNDFSKIIRHKPAEIFRGFRPTLSCIEEILKDSENRNN